METWEALISVFDIRLHRRLDPVYVYKLVFAVV